MKKIGYLAVLCLLLVLTICGCNSLSDSIVKYIVDNNDTVNNGNDTSAYSTDENISIDEEYLTSVVFAIAMTYETSAWDDDNPYDRFEPDFLWDSAGWFAAYLYRVDNRDMISEDEITEFMNVCGYNGVIPSIPVSWLDNEYGWLQVAENNYDFFHHKELIDDFLGITMSFSCEFEGNSITATLTTYIDDLESHDSIYNFVYEVGDNRAPYYITDVSIPSRPLYIPEPETEPEYSEGLNFNYDDLFEANKLSNILSIYNNIEWISSDGNSYIYTVDNSIYDSSSFVIIDAVSNIEGETYFYGDINNFSVYGKVSENIHERYCCTPYENEGIDLIEDKQSLYFSDDEKLIYLYSTDEAITFIGVSNSHCTIYTVDCGTLVLNKFMGYDNNMGESSIFYGEDAAIPDFLNSWEGKMRTVTLVKETNGEKETVTYDIPLDWELMPSEIDDGYTMYLDEYSTETYKYPGDDIDYTVYISNAVG